MKTAVSGALRSIARFRSARRTLLASGLGILVLAAPATARSWDIYANTRFSYRICYPADLLTPQPEADNGDGRKFTSATNANMLVWGNYNVSEDSLAAIADGLAKDSAGPSGTISYRHITRASAVESGRSKGDIFYIKVLLEKDTVRSFVLTYPESQAATFSAVASKVSECFRAAH